MTWSEMKELRKRGSRQEDQEEGQKAGGERPGQLGQRLIILLTMPSSPPALPICIPFLAFWSVEAIPAPLPTPT